MLGISSTFAAIHKKNSIPVKSIGHVFGPFFFEPPNSSPKLLWTARLSSSKYRLNKSKIGSNQIIFWDHMPYMEVKLQHKLDHRNLSALEVYDFFAMRYAKGISSSSMRHTYLHIFYLIFQRPSEPRERERPSQDEVNY